MSTAVVLPQMGLEVTEGLVTALTVAVGDSVAEGDVIAEVETDKAIAEVPATLAGTVLAIDVEVGETIAVGATILRLGAPGENGEPVAAAVGSPAAAAASSAPTATATAAATTTTVPAATGNGSGRRRAAPIARRAAERLGIPLERVTGTGPGGRITLGDVEREAEAAPTASPAPASAPAEGERFEELTTIRAAIARRMTESQLVPQYSLQRDVDVTWLLAEKARLSAAGPAKVGVVDLLVQALAETLVRHPLLAASFVPAGEDGSPAGLRHPAGVDVGVAVATERGLLVPVLRDTGRKNMVQLAAEVDAIAKKAREGTLAMSDLEGGTFTVTNLGAIGGSYFTPIVNYPEVAILGLGRAARQPVVNEKDETEVRTILPLSLSYDHRLIDGAEAARFLRWIAEAIEEPLLLSLEG